MAYITGSNDKMIEALKDLGIETEKCQRVIIDVPAAGGVKIYVQYLADYTVLGVIRSLESEEVKIVREPRDDVFKGTESEHAEPKDDESEDEKEGK